MMDTKEYIINVIQHKLKKAGLVIRRIDLNRPWGGFFVIEESQSAAFVAEYFPGIDFTVTEQQLKMSPKILFVAPGRRLSWRSRIKQARILQTSIACP